MFTLEIQFTIIVIDIVVNHLHVYELQTKEQFFLYRTIQYTSMLVQCYAGQSLTRHLAEVRCF